MTFDFSDKDRDIELHNYDESTGIFINTVTLKIEANTGLPAHSTITVLPTTKANQVCVFKDNKWQVLSDYRGAIWDTTTKEFTELTELGAIPAGKTNLQPYEFDEWDGDKWVLNVQAQLLATQLSTITNIQQLATTHRQAIAGNADHYQTAAWSEKARRAERVMADTPFANDIEILTTEAAFRGKDETPKFLAQAQLDKAAKFAHATAVLDGMTDAAFLATNASTTVEQVDALLAIFKTEVAQALDTLTAK